VVVGRFDGLLEDDGGNNDLATSDGAGFVRRCGEDGRAIWTVPQRSSADDSSRFFSVDTTADGNILLAGGFDGHAVFETTGPEYVVDSLGREDGILMLLRADGQPAWVRTIQSPDWSVMGPARFVGNSEIAVKGESSGSFLWSGTELGEIDVAGDTIFLLRLALETSPE
jgi:hypothetical protein